MASWKLVLTRMQASDLCKQPNGSAFQPSSTLPECWYWLLTIHQFLPLM